MSARGYLGLVLGMLAVLLVPPAALNLLLAANHLRADKNPLASAWQETTRGVTYAPPITRNRPFKTLRLNDRIDEVNAVAFGSSTMMGLTADALPPGHTLYNFAQSGHPLRAMIGEAEAILERWGGRVRVYVVPLDWALGFVFERGAPLPAELTPAAAQREAAAARPPLHALLADAVSLPRLKILAGVLRDVARAPAPAAAFRQVFFEPAGPEYRCADGTPARDFDVVSRGLCNGFRYDGSATFADQKRLDPARAPAALARAISGAGPYAAALRAGAGEPNAVLLERLARLARGAEARGARLLLLMPPLAPGVQAGLARSGHSGTLLERTRAALHDWAAAERIALLDAGASERYGCTMSEFIDAHHALPACFRKVLAAWPVGATGGRDAAEKPIE